jgi:hypothetical protein
MKRAIGGRPKQYRPPPVLQRLVISRNSLLMVSIMFGNHIAAEEAFRRYKAQCAVDGRKYVRREAIEHAAKLFDLDPRTLANLVNRSKRTRESR